MNKQKEIWGVNVVGEHICDLTGTLMGVTVSTDNGDTQYLTDVEYTNLIKKREENGYRKQDKGEVK